MTLEEFEKDFRDKLDFLYRDFIGDIYSCELRSKMEAGVMTILRDYESQDILGPGRVPVVDVNDEGEIKFCEKIQQRVLADIASLGEADSENGRELTALLYELNSIESRIYGLGLSFEDKAQRKLNISFKDPDTFEAWDFGKRGLHNAPTYS